MGKEKVINGMVSVSNGGTEDKIGFYNFQISDLTTKIERTKIILKNNKDYRGSLKEKDVTYYTNRLTLWSEELEKFKGLLSKAIN